MKRRFTANLNQATFPNFNVKIYMLALIGLCLLFTNCHKKGEEPKLMKYKVRYDFRVKNRTGNYIRLQHQGMVVVEHDDDGGIIRTLGVHTDITHLKREGKPVMAYIGMEGEPSYIDISVKSNRNGDREALTAREKEILKLLIEGKLSKQVSDILKISKQTADTHRKNMLRRNKLNNTGELVARALTKGWL